MNGPVVEWLSRVSGVVPPFCVEIILRDGSRYYLCQVSDIDKDSGRLVLRIWDFRAFKEIGFEELKSALNEVKDREALSQAQKIHPKLDWANLRIHFDDIAYCIEWHDRLWPEEVSQKIGF